MNYDLITLVRKLRDVESPEQLNDLKEFGNSLLRKEKNYAILTLMAVAEEFGDEEVLASVEKLREHLGQLLADGKRLS